METRSTDLVIELWDPMRNGGRGLDVTKKEKQIKLKRKGVGLGIGFYISEVCLMVSLKT